MALGMKGILNVSVKQDRSLPPNKLFFLMNALCKKWWLLSMIDSSLLRVLFSSTDVRVSNSMPTTEPGLLTVASVVLVRPPHHTTAYREQLPMTD